MVLTSFAVSKAQPKEKPYKLSDGGGLHVGEVPNQALTSAGVIMRSGAVGIDVCNSSRRYPARLTPDHASSFR